MHVTNGKYTFCFSFLVLGKLWFNMAVCDLQWLSISVSGSFVCLCLYVNYSDGHSVYSVYPGPLNIFVCMWLTVLITQVLSVSGSFEYLCLHVAYSAGHSVYSVYPGPFFCMWLTVLVTQCTQCSRVLCLSLPACDLHCWSFSVLSVSGSFEYRCLHVTYSAGHSVSVIISGMGEGRMRGNIDFYLIDLRNESYFFLQLLKVSITKTMENRIKPYHIMQKKNPFMYFLSLNFQCIY